MAVLYGNDAFLILVLSAKKQYYSFLKKLFVFQKIFFKVIEYLIKTCQSLEQRDILKIPSTVF